MNYLKHMALVVASLILCQAGFAGGGSHGEDGVYVNGELHIREYIEENEEDIQHVQDNKAFLESTPDFIALLKEIAGVSPEVADMIWKQLIGADIWTTHHKIPIFPEGVTYLSGPKTDVQIAARYNNDILISLPAFVREQAYTLVHEGLHGAVPGEGPFHHMRVRNVVRYFLTHRGFMNKDELGKKLSEAQIDAAPFAMPIMGWTRQLDISKEVGTLIQEKGTPESLCLLNATLDQAGGMSKFMPGYLSGCADMSERTQFMLKNIPAMTQVFDKLVETRFSPFVSTGSLEYAITATPLDRRNRDNELFECHYKTKPEDQSYLESLHNTVEGLIVLMNNFITAKGQLQAKLYDPNDQDPALTAALYVMANSPTRTTTIGNKMADDNALFLLGDTEKTLKEMHQVLDALEKQQSLFTQSIQACTTMFGQNYMSRE